MAGWLDAHNILAVRLDNIGDVVMLGPALRAVKETSPQARITLLASPAGATGAPLLPWIDDVIVWRASWQDIGGRVPFDPARELELVHLLAQRNFDAALLFTSFSQTPHVPGYVCYLAGIPLRAGETKEFGGNTLTTELRGAPDKLHQAERNLRLVEQLGFLARDRQLKVELSPQAQATALQLLAQAGIPADAPYILLHPGASAQARRYPPERFGILARRLIRSGWQVLVVGVQREAALIQRATLVICNDSLPMHLADALGTPVVVTFSGTDYEEQWQPRAVPARLLRQPTACYPCYLFECPIGHLCLDISPDDLLEAVDELLSEIGAGDAAQRSLLQEGMHE